jgi:hypothetical protein
MARVSVDVCRELTLTKCLAMFEHGDLSTSQTSALRKGRGNFFSVARLVMLQPQCRSSLRCHIRITSRQLAQSFTAKLASYLCIG